MKITIFIASSVVTALASILFFVFEFSVANVFEGALTIVGLFISPFWLIICGFLGGVTYRTIKHELPLKTSWLLGGVGGLLGILLPVLVFIGELVLSNLSDLGTALGGIFYMSQYAVVFFWLPFVWIFFCALGAFFAAVLFRKKAES